ncbi:membrane metallo-endopeptidase 1-like, partial [Tropilaelaps mercedesae]
KVQLSTTESPVTGADLCSTPGCVKAAAQIIQAIDPTADPCTDFYKFACGQWIQRHSIPEDKPSVTQFSLLQDTLNAKLRVIVEKPIDVRDDPPHVIKLKTYYHSCLNTRLLDKLGQGPLQKVLRYLGGWPVVEGFKWKGNSSFDWLQAVTSFRKLGFSHNVIFGLYVTVDLRDNSKHIISLDEPTFGLLKRPQLLKGFSDPVVTAYFKLMTTAAYLLGAKNTNKTREELADALRFELLIANHIPPQEQTRNISAFYNKMPLSGLKKLAPTIKWNEFFNSLLVDRIGDDEIINVGMPRFITEMANLLRTVNKRTLANYMIWRVVLQSYPMLSKTWRDKVNDFNYAVAGTTRENPRWEQCMKSLAVSFDLSLSNLYVKNYFHNKSEDSALFLVKYLTNEFLDIVKNVDWMDNATRERAVDKAEAIVSHIGYPTELLNDALLTNYYKNITLKHDEYFMNVLQLLKFSTDHLFRQLRKPNIKGDWKKRGGVALVNSFYNIVENCIELPASILQETFFSKDRPNYLNFGAIGFMIGHEITHGFDDKGGQFDQEGNNKNWWEYETHVTFKTRAKCIIQQYSNYIVPETNMRVNGTNTQGENIADNGGIKEAFGETGRDAVTSSLSEQGKPC